MDIETFDKALSNGLPKLIEDLKRKRSIERFRNVVVAIMVLFFFCCVVALIATCNIR